MICEGGWDPRNWTLILSRVSNFKIWLKQQRSLCKKIVKKWRKRKAGRQNGIENAFLCCVHFAKVFQRYFRDKWWIANSKKGCMLSTISHSFYGAGTCLIILRSFSSLNKWGITYLAEFSASLVNWFSLPECQNYPLCNQWKCPLRHPAYLAKYSGTWAWSHLAAQSTICNALSPIKTLKAGKHLI